MTARVPQDVDLEDTLIYGLSPIRFGYLVVAALATLALWRAAALPGPARALVCLVLPAGGAVLAWGTWRGRHVDGWLVDLAIFVRRNYRFESTPPRLPRLRRLPLLRRRDRRRRRAAGRAGGPEAIPLHAINSLTGDPFLGEAGRSDLPPAA